MPRLVQPVEAAYPPRAEAERIEADVVLQIDIGVDGKVEGVEVITPATPAGYGFDDAAAAAARQFVFSPAMAGEQPVPVRITYRYRFA
ncbi:MAG: TonB family protein, partial [Myxococcales bacterium]|nr:TonB family protein [Myxococcales bacterium]